MPSSRLIVLLVAITLSASVGCSSHHSSLRQDSSGAATIYQLSGIEALQLAHNALSEMFPGRKITEIQGPPAGYVTSYRMMLDTYSQQVLAIAAIGIDGSGNEVRGYYFEVSGSGTAIVSGRIKNSDLFDRVRQLAEQSGRPTQVRTWRPDYSVQKPPDLPRDRGLEPGGSAASRLRELEHLRRDGLISEEEYRAKRAKIIEGL